MKALVRLGNYLSTERNFMRASVVGMGVPAAMFGAWAISSYGAFVAVVTAVLAFVGAYAIQGAGAVLVEKVLGSVSNIIGLPLHIVVDLAAQLGVPLLA